MRQITHHHGNKQINLTASQRVADKTLTKDLAAMNVRETRS
uniref:Uncharacterized protein n=1 Tax=Anguilla anguilla TaxID=7936 RepID=A0A0E9WIZ4_ANGAN